jgi:non-heme chloroperoxidase
MLHFVENGYRVIAHDRRGHGRSSQISDGLEMDHYAEDAAAVVAHLVGHSTGGGEGERTMLRATARACRQARAHRRRPPNLVKAPANPETESRTTRHEDSRTWRQRPSSLQTDAEVRPSGVP